jgi:hypothetical protein
MGLNIDNSPVEAWLSKIEVAIKNMASLAFVGNLAVNQLVEREATVVVFAKEPKWTTVMA